MLMKSLAKHVGKYNIRVNAIAPGITETPMAVPSLTRRLQDNYDDNPNMLKNQMAIKRIADPKDIAYAAKNDAG